MNKIVFCGFYPDEESTDAIKFALKLSQQGFNNVEEVDNYDATFVVFSQDKLSDEVLEALRNNDEDDEDYIDFDGFEKGDIIEVAGEQLIYSGHELM